MNARRRTLPSAVRSSSADGLKELASQSSPSRRSPGEAAFFVCNSDALFQRAPTGGLRRAAPRDKCTSAPASVLGARSADMAADRRAAMAIVAKRPERRRSGNKNLRVMPVREEVEDSEDDMLNEKLNERTLGELVVSSSPAKKSSGKLAARSWLRL
ncbi:hypothetical protein ZWY2020_014895 [Hordeum vulgare]|nr:hypothetical protein ZWY2020_014895 [Hordeum vulgare]